MFGTAPSRDAPDAYEMVGKASAPIGLDDADEGEEDVIQEHADDGDQPVDDWTKMDMGAETSQTGGCPARRTAIAVAVVCVLGGVMAMLLGGESGAAAPAAAAAAAAAAPASLHTTLATKRARAAAAAAGGPSKPFKPLVWQHLGGNAPAQEADELDFKLVCPDFLQIIKDPRGAAPGLTLKTMNDTDPADLLWPLPARLEQATDPTTAPTTLALARDFHFQIVGRTVHRGCLLTCGAADVTHGGAADVTRDRQQEDECAAVCLLSRALFRTCRRLRWAPETELEAAEAAEAAGGGGPLLLHSLAVDVTGAVANGTAAAAAGTSDLSRGFALSPAGVLAPLFGADEQYALTLTAAADGASADGAAAGGAAAAQAQRRAGDSGSALAAPTVLGVLRGLETFAQLFDGADVAPPSAVLPRETAEMVDDSNSSSARHPSAVRASRAARARAAAAAARPAAVRLRLPLRVEDGPETRWRGLLVDTARHFLPEVRGHSRFRTTTRLLLLV
jgi:hypothetical protein